MRRTKYKGIVDPGKKVTTKTDLSDMDPDYVKKYFKHINRVPQQTKLKLFGNPFDDEKTN